MTKRKLTQWFAPHIKPVRVGVYETNLGYAYWHNRKREWAFGRETVYRAELFKNHLQNTRWRAEQNKVWRGLARKP